MWFCTLFYRRRWLLKASAVSEVKKWNDLYYLCVCVHETMACIFADNFMQICRTLSHSLSRPMASVQKLWATEINWVCYLSVNSSSKLLKFNCAIVHHMYILWNCVEIFLWPPPLSWHATKTIERNYFIVIKSHSSCPPSLSLILKLPVMHSILLCCNYNVMNWKTHTIVHIIIKLSAIKLGEREKRIFTRFSPIFKSNSMRIVEHILDIFNNFVIEKGFYKILKLFDVQFIEFCYH